jgi:hypothetical protein
LSEGGGPGVQGSRGPGVQGSRGPGVQGSRGLGGWGAGGGPRWRPGPRLQLQLLTKRLGCGGQAAACAGASQQGRRRRSRHVTQPPPEPPQVAGRPGRAGASPHLHEDDGGLAGPVEQLPDQALVHAAPPAGRPAPVVVPVVDHILYEHLRGRTQQRVGRAPRRRGARGELPAAGASGAAAPGERPGRAPQQRAPITPYASARRSAGTASGQGGRCRRRPASGRRCCHACLQTQAGCAAAEPHEPTAAARSPPPGPPPRPPSC